MPGLFLVLVLATIGLFVSRGNYHPIGLFCYTLSLVALGLHLLRFVRGRPLERSPQNWILWLGVCFVGLTLSQALSNPVVYPSWPYGLAAIRILAAVAAAAAIGFLFVPIRWKKTVAACAASSFILIAVAVPLTSPIPKIDVYFFQAEAARALLDGANPYRMEFTNVYGHSVFYPSGLPDSFPYPPLSIVLAVAGVLVGDIRWPLIACHLGAAFLLFRTGRLRALCADEAALLSLFFLFIPHGPFVLEQAWTEPSVVFAIGLFSYFLARRQEGAALLSAGAALALKQTAILLLPLVWALLKHRVKGRGLLLLFAPSVASYGIFTLWDFEALWNNVVRFHLATPVRLDALTYSALLHRLEGSALPPWLTGVVLPAGAAVGVWSLRRFGRDEQVDAAAVAVFFAATSLAYLGTFLFSKHAFMNYYYLLQYLILSSVLWARAAERQRPRECSPKLR
jgi:hypothetical protein